MMTRMLMNKEVRIKTTGGPAVPDPLGQNISKAQRGDICLDASFIHDLLSTFSLCVGGNCAEKCTTNNP